MRGLTQRQRQVLVWIKAWVRDPGFQRPPTLRELAYALRVRSTGTVRGHLQALQKKGLIKRERGVHRGIRLTRKGKRA